MNHHDSGTPADVTLDALLTRTLGAGQLSSASKRNHLDRLGLSAGTPRGTLPATTPAITPQPATSNGTASPSSPIPFLRRYAELAAIIVVLLLVGGGIYVYQSSLSDDDGSPAVGGPQFIEDFDLYSVPVTAGTYFNPIDVDTLEDLDDRQSFEFSGHLGFVFSDDGSTAVRIEYAREPEDREDILSADEVSIIVSNGLGRSERLRFHPPEHVDWPVLSSDGSRLLVQGALQPDSSTPPYWYIFDTVSGEIVTTIQRDNRLGGDVLFFSADASKLYRAWIAPANSSDTPEPLRIMVYDLSSGNETDRVELPDIPAASFNLDPEISVPFGPVEPFLIPAVELSVDGKSIVIAHADSNEITIVDTESLRVERTIEYRLPVAAASDVELQMSSQKRISLSPDGQSLYLHGFLSGWQQPDDVPGLLLIDLETGNVRAEAYPGERVEFVLPAPDGVSVYAMTLEQDLPGTGESSQYRRFDALTLEVLAERTFDTFTMLHIVANATDQNNLMLTATLTPPGESESVATPVSSTGRLTYTFDEAQELTPFELIQPEYVPEQLEYLGLNVHHAPDAIGDSNEVTFSYFPTDTDLPSAVPIEFRQATFPYSVDNGFDESAIEIAGRTITRHSQEWANGDLLIVWTWQEGSVHYSITALIPDAGLEDAIEELIAAVPTPPTSGATPAIQHPFAVYLELPDVDDEQSIQIPTAELESFSVIVVTTVEEFLERVDTLEPMSIWINGSALTQVPEDWLRNKREQSTVIVGINATKRELGSALGIGPGNSADWRPPDASTFVLYWEASNTDAEVSPSVRGGHSWQNDAYDPANPALLVAIVAQEIDQSESLQQ